MRVVVAVVCAAGAVIAAAVPAQTRPDAVRVTVASRQADSACAVSRSRLRSRRFGTRRLWVYLPPGGVLQAWRNVPDDGMYGTKIGWIPDRERNVTLTVRGSRLDAPGRMRVLGVFWGHSSTGKGSWASAVAFPDGGCWRITGRAGSATVSYIVRVVLED